MVRQRTRDGRQATAEDPVHVVEDVDAGEESEDDVVSEYDPESYVIDVDNDVYVIDVDKEYQFSAGSVGRGEREGGRGTGVGVGLGWGGSGAGEESDDDVGSDWERESIESEQGGDFSSYGTLGDGRRWMRV